MAADDKDILYFAYSEYLSQITFENEVSVIILENGRDGRFIPAGAGNILYVREPVSEPHGIIRLNEKFQDQFKIGQVLSFLQEAVVKDAGIQTIIEIAGIDYPTGDVLMAGQMIVGLKPGISTISSIGLCDIPEFEGSEGTLLAIGDSAVCTNPTAEQLQSIWRPCMPYALWVL